MKTLIQVTSHHINEGKFRSPYSCPIAKALEEKQILFHGVTQEGIDLCSTLEDDKRIPLPDNAVEFIHAYDEGQAVKPFEFEVEIPSEYLKA